MDGLRTLSYVVKKATSPRANLIYQCIILSVTPAASAQVIEPNDSINGRINQGNHTVARYMYFLILSSDKSNHTTIRMNQLQWIQIPGLGVNLHSILSEECLRQRAHEATCITALAFKV